MMLPDYGALSSPLWGCIPELWGGGGTSLPSAASVSVSENSEGMKTLTS